VLSERYNELICVKEAGAFRHSKCLIKRDFTSVLRCIFFMLKCKPGLEVDARATWTYVRSSEINITLQKSHQEGQKYVRSDRRLGLSAHWGSVR
jgi:hypothetical protein